MDNIIKNVSPTSELINAILNDNTCADNNNCIEY